MSDCVKKVSLSKPAGAIDKERVVGLGRRLSNRKGSSVGKSIRTAGYEAIEAVLRVQPRVAAGNNGSGCRIAIFERDGLRFSGHLYRNRSLKLFIGDCDKARWST